MPTDKQAEARERFKTSSQQMFNARRHLVKVTNDQWVDMKQRYQDGESAKALALEFGITANYVANRCGPRR